ncbi:VOC family protein (plasmid) [Deinococcus psychrotolerans]|uniref:VOC family protein n=1 Tax=Deinococcus psychrotolerans TaxID=2489213 RepID=A0A3G8YTW7_9DEIO|nr:VOC family protein [Deinococcus psychrotolerans]AZI44686.1 VOC family protein [Deinococcus psychrotolerans]
MAALEHVALKALNLERTADFYQALGAVISRHDEGRRLFAEFSSGSRLIFDAVATAPDPSALTYLGLELDSECEVDDLIASLTDQSSGVQDMRQDYRQKTGPYGFFVTDPDGYLIKVFKYHNQEE